MSFAPSYPAGGYTSPGFAAPLAPRPGSGNPVTQTAAPWGDAGAHQQTVPRPIIRAQVEDESASRPRQAPLPRRPVSIPTPEELGVASVKLAESPSVDWTAVHNQLDRLGATCFHLERLAQGGCRITCLLFTGQEGRTRRIEAQAGSEAEAIRLTLAKAQEWAGGR